MAEQTDSDRITALEEQVRLLEYVIRFAIGSLPRDVRWPVGGHPCQIGWPISMEIKDGQWVPGSPVVVTRALTGDVAFPPAESPSSPPA